jgi:hypothetical protein
MTKFSHVMRALVARIHVFTDETPFEDVDGRDKPGHDDMCYSSLRERPMKTRSFAFAASIAAFVLSAFIPALSAHAQPAADPRGFFGELFEIPNHGRLVASMQSNPRPLTAFRSDGCSGGMSEGWQSLAASVPAFAKVHGNRPPWEHCCHAHDKRYHAGPPRNADARASFSLRKAADEEARQCIVATAAAREQALATAYGISRAEVAALYRTIAEVIYRGVRAGGGPCTGLAWRWGFGLPNC